LRETENQKTTATETRRASYRELIPTITRANKADQGIFAVSLIDRQPIQNQETNMANISNVKIISIALIVIGVGLSLWGHQLSGSVGSQLTKAITGSHADKVMTLYIGGAASVIVGLYLYIKK
jgi:hypothetical protein